MYTIYTQASFACPYCYKSAKLLADKDLPHDIVPLLKADLLEVAKKANMTTVPIIYLDGALIGGYTDLEASFSQTV